MFGTQVFVKDVLKEMDLKGFFSIQRAIISNQDVYDVPNTTDLFYIGSATRQVGSSSLLNLTRWLISFRSDVTAKNGNQLFPVLINQ